MYRLYSASLYPILLYLYLAALPSYVLLSFRFLVPG